MSWLSKLNPNKVVIPAADKALPGRAKPIAVSGSHFVLDTELVGPFSEALEIAVFGMGCFWGAEKLFWSLPGVYSTQVGYAAGHTPNPSYEEVCSGNTGHNEVVRVVFDPQRLSFEDLLQVFWENHNPTQGMQQGNDVGTQYRSGIYPVTARQLEAAISSRHSYDKRLAVSDKPATTTEIQNAGDFFYAEQYHQQYLAKNPGGYCPNHGCDATGLPRA